MLKLYYADISRIDPYAVLSGFSTYRQTRLQSISHKDKRKEAIGAELILNRAVQDCFPELALPLEISCNAYGKPETAGFYFNLSHSGSFAACALSDESVGIDIQKPQSYNEAFAERFFHEQEAAFLRISENKDFDFTRLWTLKESWLKAIGRGLKTSLKSFCVQEIETHCFWHTVIDDVHFSVCSEMYAEPDYIERIELL